MLSSQVDKVFLNEEAVQYGSNLMRSPSYITPSEDAIGCLKIYEMIALDEVLEFGVVHVKLSSSSFFLFKGCDCVKVSSNQ